MSDPTYLERILNFLANWMARLLPRRVKQAAFFYAIPLANPDETIGELTVMKIMERW